MNEQTFNKPYVWSVLCVRREEVSVASSKSLLTLIGETKLEALKWLVKYKRKLIPKLSVYSWVGILPGGALL